VLQRGSTGCIFKDRELHPHVRFLDLAPGFGLDGCVLSVVSSIQSRDNLGFLAVGPVAPSPPEALIGTCFRLLIP
jgi:hypothetical protein